MPKYRVTYKEFMANETMRKRVFSICHQLGWVQTSPQTGKNKVDLAGLNAFITSDKGGFDYELNSLTAAEMQKLIYKMEEMLKKHLLADGAPAKNPTVRRKKQYNVQ